MSKTISDKPELLKQWNYSKNKADPKEVSISSSKKYWWVCDKGHEWDAEAYHRTRGDGCPYCSNRRVLRGFNDLKTTNPELLEEWDYQKNTSIDPESITPGSIKTVYWKCKNCGHEWKTQVRYRAKNGTGCPKCAKSAIKSKRQSTILKRSGGLKNTTLLLDFDYEANYPLTPKDITEHSGKIIKWKCHTCGHKWSAKVQNRTNGRGCPLCSNKIVVAGVNDLRTTHPDLAREWNYEKNKTLLPNQVSYGSSKKVWWKCPIGHEYQATINKRTSGNGTNCPVCASGAQTSFPEQAIFYYIKKLFPNAINRYKPDFLKGMELDIYIPERRIAIEYDGAPWHTTTKLSREKQKRDLCNKNDIKLIRIKENPITANNNDTYDIAIHTEGLENYKNLEPLIYEIIREVNQFYSVGFFPPFVVDLKKDKTEILKYRQVLIKDSLQERHPEIAKQWHPEKNGAFKPYMFKFGSDFKAWWICPDCGNEYEATIQHRVSGTNCRLCAIKRFTHSRCKRIEMIDLSTGQAIREFESSMDAARELGINPSNITTVCKGKRPNAGGFGWRYKN